MLGHVDVVKSLLENDADIGCRDRNHFTPLHGAAASGQVSVVRVLLDFGAKVSYKAFQILQFLERFGFLPHDPTESYIILQNLIESQIIFQNPA